MTMVYAIECDCCGKLHRNDTTVIIVGDRHYCSYRSECRAAAAVARRAAREVETSSDGRG